jgi:hypothetical protein
LTIHRSLTLGGQSFQHGDERFVSRLRPPDVMSGSVLINVVGARTRVKIKHIVIEGPASGGLIGVWAGRDTRVTMRDCVFRDIRPPAYDTAWGFIAMVLGGALQPKTKVGITGHLISTCQFDGFQTHAVVVSGTGQIATIENNRFDADGAADVPRPAGAVAPIGIIAYDGASVVIDRNNFTGHSRVGGGGAAVALINASPSSVVSFNNVDRNHLGIGLDGSSGVEVYRNAMTDNDVGLWLGWSASADSNSILYNRIEGGGTALFLDRGNANSVANNNFLNNVRGAGALTTAASSRNKFYRNQAENNRDPGFVDASLGTGTWGTANTYTSNTCSGNNGGGAQSSPAGLC